MKFQIDPKVQVAIMLFVGLLTFLGSNALPSDVPAKTAQMIHDWSVWFGQLYLVVIGPVLGLYSNSNPGPLAPQDSAAIKAVTAKEAQTGK